MELEARAFVLLRRPADAPELDGDETGALQEQHLAYLAAMHERGKLLVAGPFSDQSDESLRGLCIYGTDVAEARELAAADPAVRRGRLAVEAMTWWSERGAISFGAPAS
ncbi:MAG: uncharacterized protein QOF50_901 [Gaiellaceae bacterium]|jgi:uncharacterized protein YciI|nr:uncharacterized protein [Gaiellaceae bacterium]